MRGRSDISISVSARASANSVTIQYQVREIKLTGNSNLILQIISNDRTLDKAKLISEELFPRFFFSSNKLRFQVLRTFKRVISSDSKGKCSVIED